MSNDDTSGKSFLFFKFFLEFQSVMLYISGSVDHIIDIFLYTGVK